MTRRRMFGLLDLSFAGGGLIGGERLRARLEADLGGLRIEELPIGFAGVATEIGGGHEIWLKRGSLVEAIRASYALPGVFEPVRVDGRWLFDGAIVNPVPVSVARALGAERVIAFNISGEDRRPRRRHPATRSARSNRRRRSRAPSRRTTRAACIARWWRGSPRPPRP